MTTTKQLLLVGLAICAFAADAQECLTRTWEGTVGVVPVMIEFDTIGTNGAIAGRYYYRASLNDLLLVQDSPSQSRWKEIDPKGQVTGYFTVACSGDSLTGEWRSADGRRTQQIAARSTPRLSYSKVRLDAVKPVVVARKSFGVFHYELLKIKGQGSAVGIRLTGTGAGIDKINENLLKQFLDVIDSDIRCRAYGRLSRGEDHGYEDGAQWSVVAWNKAFVVIGSSSSGYCGGAHPYFGSGASTYDLQTGEREDVSSWLIEEYRKDIPADSSLGEILMKLYRPNGASADDDCTDIVQLSGSVVWPTSTGMVFQTWAPYASSACIENVLVPYKKIASYLSPLGKSGVRNFQNR